MNWLISKLILIITFMIDKEIGNIKNVLGTALKLCCKDPLTGFYRDGYCKTGPNDYGNHVIAAVLTQ
jgi:uncharacterized protein (DUF2237 family)